ncbi:hypothetical protein [Sphingomonas crusticola]|uniref:hypothetical protein n=1 Tax=Sphingomonas crusticola TaxID=1697973 RepID=UPI000E2522D7|nr:hypothetical protein [Sphingomonas crusticola]
MHPTAFMCVRWRTLEVDHANLLAVECFAPVPLEAHCGRPPQPADPRRAAPKAMTPEQDRRAGRGALRIFLLIALFGFGIIGAAMITAHWFPKGDEPGGVVLMGALVIALAAGLYWTIRRLLLRPRRVDEPSGLATGHRPTRAPIPIPPVLPQQKGGCLVFLGFMILILGGGIAAALGTYYVLNMIMTAVAPGSSAAYNVSLAGALIACLGVMFVLDRWCEKKTGGSVLQLLSQLSW